MSGFFSRLSRVFRGKASRGVEALEDAAFETTVKQTVRDMEAELSKVIRVSADAMSNANRLEAEYEKMSKLSADWEARAEKALESGRDDLARKALIKKHDADKQVAAMEGSVLAARDARDRLKGRVEEIRGRIEDARRTSSTLIARKNAAAAQKKVAEAMAGVSDDANAFAALGRFEDAVSREEAMARAYDELAIAVNDDLEKEFEALDASNADEELEKLKAKLEAQKREPQTA